MSRILVLAVLVSLSACGGAGRCNSSSECPAGAACDSNLGVCVVGGSSNLAAADAGSARMPSNYAHACQTTSNCGDVPGTTCEYGMCVSKCDGMTQSQCVSGTVCLGTSAAGKGFCGRPCDTDGECSTGVCHLFGFDADTAACFAQCSTPGAQSSCRTGFTCVALTGRSFGACM